MSELTFRQARADEIETVFSLLKSAALWLRDRDIDYWQNWLDPPEAHARWIRRGFENNEFFFGECEGKLIGCFRLQWKDTMFWGDTADNAGYIHSFTTRRELAGTGTGRRVLTLIESHCRERGK